MSDAGAALVDEVTSCDAGAFEVVGYDSVRGYVFAYTVEKDYRYAVVDKLRQMAEVAGVFAYGDEKSVDAAVEESLKACFLAFCAFVALAYHCVIAEAVGDVVDAAYDGGEEMVDHFGYYDAYGVGLAFPESEGKGIRTVVDA